MAMTFGMTGSQFAAWRRFVERIVRQAPFRDVCARREKWFRDRENCFVARLAKKHSGVKSE
jgi:predicted DCC family thiol-disulfide oxidoreductase YuxK